LLYWYEHLMLMLMLMGNYRFMTNCARYNFHRKFILKNVASLDSIIMPTCMSGTSDFIIKNLYPTL
jgi:hypothetical protein